MTDIERWTFVLPADHPRARYIDGHWYVPVEDLHAAKAEAVPATTDGGGAGAEEALRREAHRPCNDNDEWPDGSPCICVRGSLGCALKHGVGGE